MWAEIYYMTRAWDEKITVMAFSIFTDYNDNITVFVNYHYITQYISKLK